MDDEFMFKIIDAKGSGKTSRLMLIAKEKGYDFVCKNPPAMRSKAWAYGITGINFISYYDVLNLEEFNKNGYVIDELEDFVKYIIDEKAILRGYYESCML